MSRRAKSAVPTTARSAFELFVARAEELSRMRIIRTQGLGSQWSISAGVNQPTVFRSVEPDEEDLRSYLLTFRRFISQGEAVYIDSIHNRCETDLTSGILRGYIRDCRRGWKENVLHNGIKLTVNGSEINPAHIADLWINGHYFHDDQEKAAELRRYLPPAILFVRHEFLNFVVEATRVIGGTGYTLKMALRDGTIKA